MKSEAVLAEIEKLSHTTFLPIIGRAKGKYLVEALKRFRVKKVLEVGTLVGFSSILIAKNLPEGGRVITLEINPQSVQTARDNIERAGLTDMIEVREGDALLLIPQVNGVFDMVFLDATKSEYRQYLDLAEGKLRKGGVVFADNVKMAAREMRDFLSYVRDSGKYTSEYIDVGFDGVEISEKLG